ncbi:MAG: hypothetical protein AB7G40_17915 [Hyphomonadaceae bacterium]
MPAVDVVLVAYVEGSPGDLIDPPKKWREVGEADIANFDVPDSTVVVLHPGGEDRFHKWLAWAAARRGKVAMLAVSSDPASYQVFLRDARGRYGADALDHVFVMPDGLAMRGREEEDAVVRFLRTLAGFVTFAQTRETPLNVVDAPKLWTYFDGANTAKRRRIEFLASEAMIFLAARKLGATKAKTIARTRKRDFDGEAGAQRRFLTLDGEVGAEVFPYSLRRHLMHHTTLTQRIIGVLRSAHATEQEKTQALAAWNVLARECEVLSQQALVALNPDPLVRAAMYLADPWWTPPREAKLERESWDQAVVEAAALVIQEAKAAPPADAVERVDAFVAASAAVATASGAEAKLAGLQKVADLLGGAMKVRHGAKAVA